MDKPVDWEMSRRLAVLVNAEEGQCARNVSRAILEHPDALPNDAIYVEGAWNLEGDPDGHAWIETPTTVIDPTLAVIPAERRYRHWRDGVVRRQIVWTVDPQKVARHVQRHTDDPDHQKDKLRPFLERGNPLLEHAEHITEGFDICCDCAADVRAYFADVR